MGNEQKEKLEQEGGLAPIARLILEKGFRNPDFQEVYMSVLDISNKIARGEKVTEEQLSQFIDIVEAHKKEIDENYDGEVADIMRNYFTKFEQNQKAALIKASTPKSLDELRQMA